MNTTNKSTTSMIEDFKKSHPVGQSRSLARIFHTQGEDWARIMLKLLV
jgi:hypothetical protein